MIRKHIKVEPARWYTYCDKLGIIVWQDMPSGDRNPEWQNRKYFEGTEMKRSAESEACYRKEWKESWMHCTLILALAHGFHLMKLGDSLKLRK